MHHLINEYRPHQARETLRVMMEEQKKQRLEIAEKFQSNLDHVTEVSESFFYENGPNINKNQHY